MPDKSFEQVVPFTHLPGTAVWLPIVTIALIQPNGQAIDLPMVFDTGASVTTLRHDFYHLFGLAAWNVGQAQLSQVGGGTATFYQYPATLEVFGRTINCPVNLMPLTPNPFFVGLLGREQVFDQFGFGFWESARELYVTTTP
jgi:hypothetical protein